MVLIDTGPLVALCNPGDGRHHAATKEFISLKGSRFVTCEAVLAEAFFHLSAAPRRQRLRGLIARMDIECLNLSESGRLWRDVIEWIEKYDDHAPDWADGCIAVLSGSYRTMAVWTHDGEFHTIWKRPDGTGIPLVARSASR